MARSENTDLVVSLTLKDNLSPSLAAAKGNARQFAEEVADGGSRIGSSFDRVADKLDQNRSKIREFSRVGSELGTIGRAIGGQFGLAADAIGEFGHVAGVIGLVGESTISLGREAAASAASVLGLGTAAATATPEVAALGAAGDAAAAGGLGSLAGIIGAVAAPVAAIAVVAGGFIAFEQVANSEAAKTNEQINKQKFAVSDLHGTLVEFTGEAQAAAAAQSAVTASFDESSGHVDESSRTLKGWGGVVAETLAKNSQFFHQFTDDTKETGAGLDGIGLRARAAATDVDGVSTALLNIPTFIPVEIAIKVSGGVGAGADSTHPLTSDASDSNVVFDPVTGKVITVGGPSGAFGNRPTPTVTKTTSDTKALSEAARQVARDFDNARSAMDRLFSSLDQRLQNAITHTLNLAKIEHDRATQAIADNLKAEQAEHAKPVTAAEAALNERQTAQQRRNLVEAQQAASAAVQANVDPAQAEQLARALRDATESLQNFDAAQAIARLQVVEKTQDDKSQAAADAAQAAADKVLADAERQARLDAAAEAKADVKRRADFTAALAKLQVDDKGKPRAQQDADIAALQKKFGVFVDPVTGLTHIEDPVVRALKDIKVEPHLTVNNNQTFRLILGTRELGILAQLVESQQQPASTASSRTGSSASR